MHVLIPLLAVLTALDGRWPDGRDVALGPLVGAAIGGSSGGPRALVGAAIGGLSGRPGALAGALVGDEIDKRQTTKADPDAAYAAELLDILNATKSPQTYGLTLMLLVESKADPLRVVPVAIRNAERLGIFGKKTGLYPDGPDELAGIVADLIQKLARTAHRPVPVPKSLDLVRPANADETHPIRTVYVPAFRKEAKGEGRSNLEADLTAATVRAVGAKTAFKVVSDPKDADTELLGTITGVERTVLKRDGSDAPAARELVVTVEVVWRDCRTGEVLSGAGHVGDSPPTPVRIRAVAEYRPEVGGTVQSAKEQTCARVAAEVVSLLEKSWRDPVAPQKQHTRDKPKALPGAIVPVQPWQTERMQEKYRDAADPWRVPILPPVRDGFPPPIDCCDEPSDKTVLAALPPLKCGVPLLYAESRSDFRIKKELETEWLEAARFYPLVGSAQAHHGTWKCTVTFTETIASDYPFPVKVSRERTEVVRVQATHLHFINPPTGPLGSDLSRDFGPAPPP